MLGYSARICGRHLLISITRCHSLTARFMLNLFGEICSWDGRNKRWQTAEGSWWGRPEWLEWTEVYVCIVLSPSRFVLLRLWILSEGAATLTLEDWHTCLNVVYKQSHRLLWGAETTAEVIMGARWHDICRSVAQLGVTIGSLKYIDRNRASEIVK